MTPWAGRASTLDIEFVIPSRYDHVDRWKSDLEASMPGNTAKQKILEAIEKLPADATLEDAIERLVFLAKVERGLAELDAGKGVDHTEAKRRLVR